jgi:hypothetical protein
VPQQDARKNYIGIVSDTTEDERIADTAVRSQPHVVSYLVGRLAAVLGAPAQGRAGTRHHGVRRGVTTAPMPFTPHDGPRPPPASVHLNWIMKPSFNGCYDKTQSARSAAF